MIVIGMPAMMTEEDTEVGRELNDGDAPIDDLRHFIFDIDVFCSVSAFVPLSDLMRQFSVTSIFVDIANESHWSDDEDGNDNARKKMTSQRRQQRR